MGIYLIEYQSYVVSVSSSGRNTVPGAYCDEFYPYKNWTIVDFENHYYKDKLERDGYLHFQDWVLRAAQDAVYFQRFSDDSLVYFQNPNDALMFKLKYF